MSGLGKAGQAKLVKVRLCWDGLVGLLFSSEISSGWIGCRTLSNQQGKNTFSGNCVLTTLTPL